VVDSEADRATVAARRFADRLTIRESAGRRYRRTLSSTVGRDRAGSAQCDDESARHRNGKGDAAAFVNARYRGAPTTSILHAHGAVVLGGGGPIRANATSAQAAALKNVGGGTAGTVTTDMTGTSFEVIVTKTDGTQVEVHLDRSFNTVTPRSLTPIRRVRHRPARDGPGRWTAPPATATNTEPITATPSRRRTSIESASTTCARQPPRATRGGSKPQTSRPSQPHSARAGARPPRQPIATHRAPTTPRPTRSRPTRGRPLTMSTRVRRRSGRAPSSDNDELGGLARAEWSPGVSPPGMPSDPGRAAHLGRVSRRAASQRPESGRTNWPASAGRPARRGPRWARSGKAAATP